MAPLVPRNSSSPQVPQRQAKACLWEWERAWAWGVQDPSPLPGPGAALPHSWVVVCIMHTQMELCSAKM